MLECLNARNIHHYNHGHSENATVTLKISFGWKFTAVDHIKEYESSKFPIYHSFLLPVTLHSFESQFLLLFYLWVMLCWCIRKCVFLNAILMGTMNKNIKGASFISAPFKGFFSAIPLYELACTQTTSMMNMVKT